jgi:tetratricopeptide (TPR) repeat protein
VKTLRFFLGLAIAGSFLGAQGPQPDGPLRGEIHAAHGLPRNDLVVELRSTSGSGRAVRAEVGPDGTFELRGIDPGTYDVVVRTQAGAVLQEQAVDIATLASPVVIELTETKVQRPASGPVSVAQLSSPPPKQARKMAVRALNLSNAGEHAKAAAELEKAIQIAPEFADAHNDLGVQYVALGRHEEALAQFQAAVRIAPGMSRAYSNLAWVLLKLGRPADAESTARHAVELDPANLRAHLILGSLLAVQPQRREEAVRELRLAVPEAPSALLKLAGLYASAGESRKAEEALQQYRQRQEQPAPEGAWDSSAFRRGPR